MFGNLLKECMVTDRLSDTSSDALMNMITIFLGLAVGSSAVPMAARVDHKVVPEENPGNFLIMHAMVPNVAGVIGSAVVAGILLSLFG